MQHCEDETLALIALGESGTSDDEAHVRQCPRCQSRLDQLSAVVAATRAVTQDDRPLAPPDHVWDSIVEELGLGSDRASVAVLADERAMSQKHSPFRSIGALADYAATLVAEQ